METNRGVIIPRPTQLLVDWLNRIEGPDDQTSLADARREPTAYLVSSWEDDRELERVLKRGYRQIFETELEGWTVDPSLWPEAVSYKMFRKWFDIEALSMVHDFGERRFQRLELEV